MLSSALCPPPAIQNSSVDFLCLYKRTNTDANAPGRCSHRPNLPPEAIQILKFTCFTSAKAQILTLTRLADALIAPTPPSSNTNSGNKGAHKNKSKSSRCAWSRPVFAYGGDYGPEDTPSDEAFCINGLFQPDRRYEALSY